MLKPIPYNIIIVVVLSTMEQLWKYPAANKQALMNTPHQIQWTTCCQHAGNSMVASLNYVTIDGKWTGMCFLLVTHVSHK